MKQKTQILTFDITAERNIRKLVRNSESYTSLKWHTLTGTYK